jgi:hypothetical protein
MEIYSSVKSTEIGQMNSRIQLFNCITCDHACPTWKDLYIHNNQKNDYDELIIVFKYAKK